MAKPPRFIGIFPSQFPGFGSDEKPVFHHKTGVTKDGDFVLLRELQETPCDMAFHPPGGRPCMSSRYGGMGVSGIDASGNCWVLVRDYAIQNGGPALRWVKFEAPVAE